MARYCPLRSAGIPAHASLPKRGLKCQAVPLKSVPMPTGPPITSTVFSNTCANVLVDFRQSLATAPYWTLTAGGKPMSVVWSLSRISVMGATMPPSALMRANWSSLRMRSLRAPCSVRSKGMMWLAMTG